jgi:multidrug efflux pump subunit AcrB
MWLAAFASKRPYMIVASLILLCLLTGVDARLRMPVDIFPQIDIPVVSVVWAYNAMSAPDIGNRILTLHELQLASPVDDIGRIEATSRAGVGYLREGANDRESANSG